MFNSQAPDICLEGPRGTGKSYAWALKLLHVAESYPGARLLVTRKTLQSLRESWQVTFEEKVLGHGHPLLKGRSRAYRRSYDFRNGSVIVLGGLDEGGRWYSTEWDIVLVSEAIEIVAEKTYDDFHACLRNHMVPYQQLACDVNPGDPNHWLKKRMDRGDTLSIKSRHADNPGVTEEYLERLSKLRGVQRARWLEGLWVANEGLVWPNFDRKTHVVPRSYLVDPETGVAKSDWHFGSIDWGWTNPGCFQVWGVHGTGLERTMVCIHEVYATEKGLDWWAQQVVDAHEKWGLLSVVCDPASPEKISYLNDRLGSPMDREAGGLCRPADNRKTEKGGGLDMVRWALGEEGEPARLFWVEDCLAKRDPKLDEQSKPCGSLEEIGSYTWAEWKDGQPHNEDTDKSCADHAMDATRYAACFAWKRDVTIPHVEKWDQVHPETGMPQYGRMMDHERVLRAPRRHFHG